MVKSKIKELVRDSFIIVNGGLLRFFKKSRGGRIITFHEIKNREVFREKMQWLKERFKILPLEQIVTGGEEITNVSLAITFDDGYSSWHEVAAPVLEALNLPAVFFVSSGFVGLEGEEARQFLKNCFLRSSILKPLTHEQVVDISKNPLFEIGSHTASHINLGERHSSEVLEREVDGDIKRLEGWTGKKVRWLAYPFGGKEHFCSQSKKYLRESQIEAAFTIIPGFVESRKDFYEIGRDSFDEESSLVLWEGWLNGGYDVKGRL